MQSRDTAFYKVKCVIIIISSWLKGIINSNNISPYYRDLLEKFIYELSYKFHMMKFISFKIQGYFKGNLLLSLFFGERDNKNSVIPYFIGYNKNLF